MIKIALIHGQNHKGSTYHIGRMLADKLTDQDNIQEIFLPRDMPEFCCGCTQCFMKSEKLCPHYKYIEPITKIMDEADVLIFTTPVYVYHSTGSMKALLDHYGYRWMIHRPEEKMFKKQAVCISTAAGGGMKTACKDIKDSLFFWGVPRIYCYGTAVAAVSWDAVSNKKKVTIEKKVTILEKKVRNRAGNVTVSAKTKIYFAFMRWLEKQRVHPADNKYWAEKGWNKKNRPWKKEKVN